MKKEINHIKISLIILAFAFIIALIMHYTKADLTVYNIKNSFCNTNCIQISEQLTRLGDGWIQFILCIILGIFYYTKTNYNLSKAWFYAVPISILAGTIGQIIKMIFGRPRPKLLPELYDFQWLEIAGSLRGFPSGHTLTSFVIVAVVASYYNVRGKIILFSIASIVGLSRITVNAHFMSDVVFGAALGYFLGVILKDLLIKKQKGLK